jgi:hypothetical protein
MQRREDSVQNGVSAVTLDHLIRAVITGQRYNQQRLGTEALRYSRKLSNIYGRDLPEDIHEEVFTQAFVEVFKFGPTALAAKSGKALFRAAVLNAVRVVRASYAPPGCRTRPTGEPEERRVIAEDIGRIPDQDALARATVGDGNEQAIDLDLLGDAVCTMPVSRQIRSLRLHQ